MISHTKNVAPKSTAETDGPKSKARVIAFYLPQFHPIPENDEWWGEGFTEWTNVALAKNLFPGHSQPNVPGELGFYDLRLPESRQAQADLATAHGVNAFCYWHYWFGHGRRLLERPFAEVLKSGEPDFPFCLAWANETWAGLLHGAKDRILLEQTYPGIEDYKAHFELVVEAFADRRYVKVSGKPVFLIYKPGNIPDNRQFIDCWQHLARERGFPGIHFVGVADRNWKPSDHGFDAAVLNEPRPMIDKLSDTAINRLVKTITGRNLIGLFRRLGLPGMYSYADMVKKSDFRAELAAQRYPVVVPNWDTTPRCGKYGHVFYGSTPELFREHLNQALESLQERDPEERILFLKSWNEWAEGNYVEPDRRNGRQYLEVIKSSVLQNK